MMGRFMRGASSRRRAIETLVRQVADASVEGVLRIARDRMAGMSPCEARGYLRGRAGAEIRRQARRAFARELGVQPVWQVEVIGRAAELVPALALRRMVALRQSLALRQAA
jgi:hypothetical protein